MPFREKVLSFFIFASLIWFSFACEHLQIIYQHYVIIFLGLNFLICLSLKKFWISLKDPVNFLFIIYIFALLISMEFAFSKKISSNYLYIPLISFFVYLQIQGFDIKKYRFKLSQILSVIATVVFIFGVYEYIVKKNILYESLFFNPFYQKYIGRRVMSFHYHPSVLATYFLCCLPFSIYLIEQAKTKKQFILGCIATFSSVGGIILTFTRTAFLIMFVVSLFYFSKNRRRFFIYVLTIGVMFLIFMTLLAQKYQIFERFSLINPYHYTSLAYRLERVPVAIEIWEIQPFTGVGFGNFRYLFDIYHSKYTPYEFKIPDNMYLSLLSETGLFGILSLILFVFSLIYSSLKKIKNFFLEDRTFVKLMLTGFIMVLLNMLSYDLFYWRMPLYFFWFYAGILNGYKDV